MFLIIGRFENTGGIVTTINALGISVRNRKDMIFGNNKNSFVGNDKAVLREG